MGRTKDTLKLVIGRVAERTFPQLARDIDQVRNTARAPMLKRAILHARLHRAKARGDHAAVEKALSASWKGHSGDSFFGRYADARFGLFIEQHYAVIDALRELLETDGNGLHRLVEIGCGEGRVAAHCAEHLPALTTAFGLDINATVVERARADHREVGKLSFVEADATDWLEANPEPGTVLLSNGGVLEYFSPQKFDRLLTGLAAHPPAAVVLIEPVAMDHDLEKEPDSKVFGIERSFSHNHRHRLTRAGFEILFGSERQIGDVRWMLMLALNRGARAP